MEIARLRLSKANRQKFFKLVTTLGADRGQLLKPLLQLVKEIPEANAELLEFLQSSRLTAAELAILLRAVKSQPVMMQSYLPELLRMFGHLLARASRTRRSTDSSGATSYSTAYMSAASLLEILKPTP